MKVNTTQKRNRIGLALFLLIMTCILVTTLRQLRQDRLDHALIDAIKAHDDTAALEALEAGANANAVDTSDVPPTWFQYQYWVNLRHGLRMYAREKPPSVLWLALHSTINPDIVQSLLDHGANVNYLNRTDETTLYYVIQDKRLHSMGE